MVCVLSLVWQGLRGSHPYIARRSTQMGGFGTINHDGGYAPRCLMKPGDLRVRTDQQRVEAYTAAVRRACSTPESLDLLLPLVESWLARSRDERDDVGLYWHSQWEAVIRSHDIEAIARFSQPRSPYDRAMLLSSPLYFLDKYIARSSSFSCDA